MDTGRSALSGDQGSQFGSHWARAYVATHQRQISRAEVLSADAGAFSALRSKDVGCRLLALRQRRLNGKTALAWASDGRLDNDGDVSVGEAAGTTTRAPRVPTSQPFPVERMDHISHRVLTRGHQPGRIAGTVTPDAAAMKINARRTRIGLC
jgi:hypothetical protein